MASWVSSHALEHCKPSASVKYKAWTSESGLRTGWVLLEVLYVEPDWGESTWLSIGCAEDSEEVLHLLRII